MEVALHDPGTFRRSPGRGSPLPLRPLVAERSRSSTPTHLLETKFYGKLKSNSLIQAEPAEVHFSGFQLGKKYCSTLQLINISTEVMNIHILPTQTKYFQTTYTKKHRLVPGLAYAVKIHFCPDEWRYFYDSVRVHCKGEENLLIPVHGYPVIDDLYIPSHINLRATALQQSVSRAIPLRCSCPIDFEFQIFVIENSQAFSIQPLAGVIPANSQVDIVVTFTPVQYETAQITFKLVVSQFNTKPFLCTVTGSSKPHVALSQVEKKLGHKEAAAPASQVATRCKTWSTKISVKPKKLKEKDSKHQIDILTHGGVAKMMIRETSKLHSKALKEDFTLSRQVKEALFLKKVTENERNRQERCRQWQVDHVGEEPVCGKRRRDILEEREEALQMYTKAQRGEATEQREIYFGKPLLSNERVVLDVGQTPDITPEFQFHPCINWDFKHRCLELFQQAAYKIVIQCRMNRRLLSLRKLIKEMKEPRTTQEETAVVQCTRISPEKLFIFSHPTFSAEDDPLALDLSPLPAAPTEWSITTSVPFFKLKVPQHFKLMGYEPVSTLDAYTSYIPTTLARPLRSPPEEEEAEEGAAKDHGSQAVEHEEKTEGLEPKLKDLISYKFTAPDFQPAPAHPLRIFNPAPGLHAHRPTPKYLESYPEYYLCPQQTYQQKASNDASAVTQDYLMDKEVAEEIMTWKKDFGTILSNCLSKHRSQTHMELPSRSSYNKEFLPVQAPYLQSLPDELSHLKDKPPTTSPVELTPEMVKAEMLKVFQSEVPKPSRSEPPKPVKKELKKDNKK
ncbi:cilia- and flagella-associated protein 221 [Boleophthalmus pectinirostris]|uniref:cilia- and flagella-associated protein 221 n=1 Tax=Boleophthalmus pectinirostris TaxID=150288 RepID=UPI00242C7AD8|nr:cilia- and flagella-associated protein 221 [Boleophthalmus pectinirostris]